MAKIAQRTPPVLRTQISQMLPLSVRNPAPRGKPGAGRAADAVTSPPDLTYISPARLPALTWTFLSLALFHFLGSVPTSYFVERPCVCRIWACLVSLRLGLVRVFGRDPAEGCGILGSVSLGPQDVQFLCYEATLFPLVIKGYLWGHDWRLCECLFFIIFLPMVSPPID